MDSVLLFFSFCFPMVAGHDLLDHLPTEAYWKAKHVTISGEAMLAQLQHTPNAADAPRLIRELGDADFAVRENATLALINAGSVVADQIQAAMQSDDPEVATRAKRIAKLLRHGVSETQVRRLMAIRTLGELKFAKAGPVLKELADDDANAVAARYARRAWQHMQPGAGPENAPAARDVLLPTRAQLHNDMLLLPASSFGVLQVLLREPMRMPLEPGLDFKPFFGKGIPAFDREPRYLAKLIAMVDTVGYARIDSVCASVAHGKKSQHIYASCVVRGEWDVATLRAMLVSGGFEISVEQGLEVATFQDHCKVLLASHSRMLVTFGDREAPLPIKQLLAGQAAEDLLMSNKPLWTLVENGNDEAPLWGAMIPTELSRELPWLAPMKELTFEAEQQGTEFKLSIDVQVGDPAKIEPALKEFEQMLDKAVPEAGQIAAMFRCAKPLAELMDSLETARHSRGVSVTMQTPNLAPLLAMPLVLTNNEWLK